MEPDPDLLDSEEEEELREEMALGARWTIAAAAGRLDSKARYWRVAKAELEDWLKLVRTSRTFLQDQLREPEAFLKGVRPHISEE